VTTGRMTSRHWWLLAVAGTGVLSGAVLWLTLGLAPRFWIGIGILVAFTAFWGLFVVRPHEEDTPRSVVALVVTVVVTGALTSIDTSLAFFQVIAFPAAWTLLGSIRRSVIASVAVAVVVGIAFPIRLGFTPATITLAVAIEGLSFVFAIAMGVWISRIADLGNERKRLLDELTAAQSQLAMLHRVISQEDGCADRMERDEGGPSGRHGGSCGVVRFAITALSMG